jgi:hypothetical protein
VDHGPIAQHGQIEAVAVEGDELRGQRDLVAESSIWINVSAAASCAQAMRSSQATTTRTRDCGEDVDHLTSKLPL